jgi:hypothetical protein
MARMFSYASERPRNFALEAALDGDLEALTDWLDSPTGDANAQVPLYTPSYFQGEVSTSLLVATILGDSEDVSGHPAGTVSVVRELISRGADASHRLTVIDPEKLGYEIRGQDAGGYYQPVAWASSLTPLHVACTAQRTRYGAVLVAAILSAPGVDVNEKTTPAEFATTSPEGYRPWFDYPSQTPLAGALLAPHENGRFAIVSALLRAGASLDEISNGDSAEACVRRRTAWMRESNIKNDREATPPVVTPQGMMVYGSEARPHGANLASLKALLAITRRQRVRARARELVRFRSLLARGRANATPATPRVVAWMMDPRTPREVAWKVFGFWRAQV